jgi:hypothetical protein
MKRFVFVVVFAFYTISAFGQVVKKKEEPKKNSVSAGFSLVGQVSVATNGEAIFTNFGGPNVKFEKKKFWICVSMFPSLRFMNDAPRATVIPTLGTGLLVGYGKLYFIAPGYYNNVTNQWSLALGVGIRFK